MQLTDEQKKKVAEWLDEGLKLSDIQTRIGKDFDVKLTYMEVRFLIDDLKLKVKDPVVEVPPEPPTPAPGAPAGTLPGDPAVPTAPEPMPPAAGAAGFGAVKVTVDTLARPGTMVSGGVTFSDGQKATWYLDQMGRLGLAADTKGYRPSQEDLVDFQTALQNEIAKLGF